MEIKEILEDYTEKQVIHCNIVYINILCHEICTYQQGT